MDRDVGPNTTRNKHILSPHRPAIPSPQAPVGAHESAGQRCSVSNRLPRSLHCVSLTSLGPDVVLGRGQREVLRVRRAQSFETWVRYSRVSSKFRALLLKVSQAVVRAARAFWSSM